ncbi:MAG: protein-L-isoaspartate(D-aspartate) O-methyltransferase [Gammaproteobacteria bacterium]
MAVKSDDNHYAGKRAAMIDHIEDYAQARELGEGQIDPAVMAAMNRVPRHRFVPAHLRDRAYENEPLPIGHGQTISQPYIVALMTDLLDVEADDNVLEIGTGSGYQAAVLAELAGHVYTVEIIEPLAEQAAERLAQLGYDNLTSRVGDGYHGWPEHAPFDAIMVTAGADHLPPPLVRQLKPGGTMIIPVSSGAFTQHLMLVQKTPEGAVEKRQLLPVLFVPLTGDR